MKTFKKYNNRLLWLFLSFAIICALVSTMLSIQSKAIELPTKMDDVTVDINAQGIVTPRYGQAFNIGIIDPIYQVGTTTDADGKKAYYIDFGEQDCSTRDFVIELYLNHSEAKTDAFLNDPSGVKNSIVFYDDISLTSDHQQSLSFDFKAYHPEVNTTITYGAVTFPAGSLEPEKDYYMVFPPSTYPITPKNKLGYALIMHFKTASAPAVNYGWQGDTVQVLWTEPSSNYLSTETATAETDSTGLKYYYNECSRAFCPGKDQTFSFDVKGPGTNNIYGSGATGNNAGTEPPANHIFVYSDKSLSQESLVASAANGKISDVQVGDPKTSDGMKNVSFTIPKNTLEDDKDYYLVTDENLETNKQNGIPRVVGAKIITKISAKHDNVKAIPDIRATCTESGWYGKTQCETCGSIIDEGKEIPATGHVALTGDNAIYPTCTKEGWYPGSTCFNCGIKLEEPHTIPALGHDVELVETKAPTCEEPGSKEGVCSRCNEVIKETIPAKGHTPVPIGEAKAATCTEKGLTDGKKCSVCGETLKAQEEIPALGHDFKDGKCTRCGEKDPDYKPAVQKQGFVKDEDGVIRYYEDDKVATGVTDVKYDPKTGNWYNTVKGIVTPGPTVQHNAAGWWYIDKDGKVDFNYTGLASNDAGTWYCKNAKVDFSVTGVVYDYANGEWIYVKNNKLTMGPTVQYNDAGWWYVNEKGRVDFKYNGLGSNAAGTWVCQNSKVDFKYNGKYNFKGKTYTVQNSKVIG